MRLLNSKTLKLEEFPSAEQTPAYAILSHTWEKEEVSFQAIADLESAAQLIGFSKIKACCRQAISDGYEWVWIDTCCIDKSSSAELSEAINSMFRWYKESAICYAYLTDVCNDVVLDFLPPAFWKSRWFTRGWTLQELIAPCELRFFYKDWTSIGHRKDLSSTISFITKIDADVLTLHIPIEQKSIAQRMSWASHRSTTRSEDMAYCLMGLFDVNMPLLYGEGKKAFIRLQEEILKRCYDQSLFAWTTPKPAYTDENNAVSNRLGGLLANSPSDFEHSNQYFPVALPFFSGSDRPFSMTNLGLCIDLPIFHLPRAPLDEWIAIIGCDINKPWNNRSRHTRMGLHLKIHADRKFAKGVGISPHSRPRKALRDVQKSPVTLIVRDLISSDGKEWVKVDPYSQESVIGAIRAEVTTLYFAQDARSSFLE